MALDCVGIRVCVNTATLDNKTIVGPTTPPIPHRYTTEQLT
jgi:hypothetical protein